MTADERVLRDRIFREVMAYPPERVKQTLRTQGEEAARKQASAIALDEIREKTE